MQKKSIKIQCPAKINLDLKVYKKDKITGFHPIRSVMQAISLYDYITISLDIGDDIILSGNSDEIPYDDSNLCYKAAKLFLNYTNKNGLINIYIDKNIPVCAGLAGGSTDAGGVLLGLNILYNNPLSETELHYLASKLGSDVNFCLEGATQLCTGRGEKLDKLPFNSFKLSLVKPKELKISAKEAYIAFDNLDSTSDMKNDLEYALLNRYEELQYLNSNGMQMSGSGPTYFLMNKNVDFQIDEKKFLVINDLNSVDFGIREIS